MSAARNPAEPAWLHMDGIRQSGGLSLLRPPIPSTSGIRGKLLWTVELPSRAHAPRVTWLFSLIFVS